MRNHVLGAAGKAVDRPPGANGATRTGEVRRKRRRWSVEEKLRVARESLASGETITAVAKRHGVPRNRLSAWHRRRSRRLGRRSPRWRSRNRLRR